MGKNWLKWSLMFAGGAVAVIFLLAMLQGRNRASDVLHVGLQHEPNNRLRFKVTVETSRESDVYVQYWPTQGGDTLYTQLSPEGTRHSFSIVNVREGTNYQFQAITRRDRTWGESKVYSFSTDAIYQATPFLTLNYVDSTFESHLTNKYFLTQKLDQPGAVIMMDHRGNTVWYESFQKGVRVSNWTKHNTALCILGHDSIPFSGGDEIVELTLSGKVVTHLRRGEGDMDKVVHHDVRIDEHDNIYALTFDWKKFDLRAAGGGKADSVLGDGIVVFDKKGKKVWEWSVFDHLNPLDDPKILKDRRDWVHANGLTKAPDGDYIISFRDLNQVWKVDDETGEVKWKLGKNGDFDMDPNDFFSGQHSPHINNLGQVMMLDNGIQRKQTRVLCFDINTQTMKATRAVGIELPKEYFSIPKGNAYEFDDDRYLLCLSQPRAILITDHSGNILWKVSMGGDPYRVELIDGLNEKSPI